MSLLCKAKLFWVELVVGCRQGEVVSDIEYILNNIRHSLTSYATSIFEGKTNIEAES